MDECPFPDAHKYYPQNRLNVIEIVIVYFEYLLGHNRKSLYPKTEYRLYSRYEKI